MALSFQDEQGCREIWCVDLLIERAKVHVYVWDMWGGGELRALSVCERGWESHHRSTVALPPPLPPSNLTQTQINPPPPPPT
jgi:hypothetical protein